VRLQVFKTVTIKNAALWDITPCGSCKNRSSIGTSVLTRATRRNIPDDGVFHFVTCLVIQIIKNVVTSIDVRSARNLEEIKGKITPSSDYELDISV
jgi:hypothetical protein